MKKPIVIYPFLFALFPVLALYAHNMGELYLSSIWVPLAVSFGFALILFALSWLIFRDAIKAGIITSVFLVIFFADGHFRSLLEEWGWIRPVKYLPIAWGICFIVIVYLIARTKRQLKNLTNILNIIGVSLIVITSVNITVNEFRRPHYDTHNISGVEIKPSEVSTLPDIYYIILDGYSSATTLEELYNHDNSPFIDYLRGKGFYIADQSVSNYSYTQASLASSLNMEYVNYLSDAIGNQSKDLRILTEMVKNNRVLRFLKSMGYYCVHFESPQDPTTH